METIIAIHNESEYNEILRQAVAVIESARIKVASAIVRTSNEMHRDAVGVLPWWNINKLIAKLGDDDDAILYYAEQTIAKKWIVILW